MRDGVTMTLADETKLRVHREPDGWLYANCEDEPELHATGCTMPELRRQAEVALAAIRRRREA